jgi:hypothetical protein
MHNLEIHCVNEGELHERAAHHHMAFSTIENEMVRTEKVDTIAPCAEAKGYGLLLSKVFL